MISFHTFVDVDDFDCPKCDKITMATLNMQTKKYKCQGCGKAF